MKLINKSKDKNRKLKKNHTVFHSMSVVVSMLIFCLSISSISFAEASCRNTLSEEGVIDIMADRSSSEIQLPELPDAVTNDNGSYDDTTQSVTEETMGDGYNESYEVPYNQSVYSGDNTTTENNDTEEDSEISTKTIESIPEQVQVIGQYCCVIFPDDDDINLYNSNPVLEFNGISAEYLNEIGVYNWDNSLDEVDRGTDYYIVIDASKNYTLDSFKELKSAISDIKDELHDGDTVTFYLTNREKENEFFGVKYTSEELENIDLTEKLDEIERGSDNLLYSRVSEVLENISEDIKQEVSSQNIIDDADNSSDDESQDTEADDTDEGASDRDEVSTDLIEKAFSNCNRKALIVFTTGYDTTDNSSVLHNLAEKKWKYYGIPVHTVLIRELSDDVKEENKTELYSERAIEFAELTEATGGKSFIFGSYDDYSDMDDPDDEQEDAFSEYYEGDYVSEVSEIIENLNSKRYVAYFMLTDEKTLVNSEYISIDFSIIEEPYYGDKKQYIYQNKRVHNDVIYRVPVDDDVTETTTEDDSSKEDITEDSSDTESSDDTEEITSEKDNNENTEENDTEKKSKKNNLKEFLKKYLILLSAVLLLVIVLVVILIITHCKRKKYGAKPHNARNVSATGRAGKMMEVISETETLKPVSRAQNGIPMTMQITYGNGKNNEITAYINGSAIVGRSESCDVFIDDGTISRQHFVIEYANGEFYVQDLETTNGTFLNGVRLTHKRRIEKKDIIKAGALEICVRW